MWSNMWQCPTLERDAAVSPLELKSFAQMRSLDPASLVKVGSLTHQTTHRTMGFDVYTATPVACKRKQTAMRWVDHDEFGTVGISNAQLKVIRLATRE
jgi:adenine-specific DNA glycosylase